VEINFGKAEVKLQDFSKFRHGYRKRRGRRARGTADHLALTIFSTLENHQVLVSQKNKRKVDNARQKERPPRVEMKDAIPYLVKLTSETRLEPRARQVVLGKLELRKRQEPPELVY
jgi:phage terminase small subunit